MNSPRRPQRRDPRLGYASERRDYPDARRTERRHSPSRTPERTRTLRIRAIVTGLVVFAGMFAIAQMSIAGTRRGQGAPPPCTTAPGSPTSDPTADPTTDPTIDPSETALPTAGTIVEADGTHQHIGDGQVPPAEAARGRGSGSGSATCTPTTSAGPVVQPDSPGRSCENSTLSIHDGFQNGNRCVSVEHGEVPTAENSPSLLIVSAPFRVRVNQPFEIRVSSRNLVRDFFLPAAQGGYFATRSFLTEDGLTHGHAHTAIRPLTSTRTAPDPAPVPTFFVATEDGRGGRTPDTFVVRVPGIANPGLYQIAVWCGEASHRVAMAQRANQTPCFDATRLIVTRR